MKKCGKKGIFPFFNILRKKGEFPLTAKMQFLRKKGDFSFFQHFAEKRVFFLFSTFCGKKGNFPIFRILRKCTPLKGGIKPPFQGGRAFRQGLNLKFCRLQKRSKRSFDRT